MDENDNRPPWAAYRALKTGTFIALDKNLGVHPIAIGKVYMQRLIANCKCVLSLAKGEAQESCGMDQPYVARTQD